MECFEQELRTMCYAFFKNKQVKNLGARKSAHMDIGYRRYLASCNNLTLQVREVKHRIHNKN